MGLCGSFKEHELPVTRWDSSLEWEGLLCISSELDLRVTRDNTAHPQDGG